MGLESHSEPLRQRDTCGLSPGSRAQGLFLGRICSVGPAGAAFSICKVPRRADLGGGGFACRSEIRKAACEHVGECVYVLTHTGINLQLLS